MTMYPLNINQADKDNEAGIMAKFMRYINHEFDTEYIYQKIPEPTEPGAKRPDFKVYAPGHTLVGIVEVKRRNLTLERMVKYGGLFLSEKKYAMLLRSVIRKIEPLRTRLVLDGPACAGGSA